MNLSQLRYVKAVADTVSFTQAAEQCYVTQPTLSNGIAQLEQELEEKLFTRTTRAVSLTPFGEHILKYVNKLLAAQDELLHETRNFAHLSQKALRIGISPLIRSTWLGPVLEEFRQALPEVQVILHEQNMGELYRMLDDGLLDFVFGVEDIRKPSWNAAFLYREPLYYIPSGANRPPDEKAVFFEDVAGETFVMVPNICGLARATRALFRSHRRKLNEYPGEALSYQVLEEWAALGMGAAILPKSKLLSSVDGAYILSDKKGNEINLAFEAVWPNNPQRPEHLRKFSEFLAGQRERPQA